MVSNLLRLYPEKARATERDSPTTRRHAEEGALVNTAHFPPDRDGIAIEGGVLGPVFGGGQSREGSGEHVANRVAANQPESERDIPIVGVGCEELGQALGILLREAMSIAPEEIPETGAWDELRQWYGGERDEQLAPRHGVLNHVWPYAGPWTRVSTGYGLSPRWRDRDR